MQDLLRLTYNFGIHGRDNEVTAWPALPGNTARALTNLGFDASGNLNLSLALAAGTLSLASIVSFLDADPIQRQSSYEIGAAVTPVNMAFPADGLSTLNVFRFFTPTQVAAVLSGANSVDVSAAVQAANDFLEGRAAGCIGTLGAITGGSGYVNGTYPAVRLTGGGGSFALASITVSGGTVTAVTLLAGGTGYAAGNVLSASASSVGGAGSGFSIRVATLATGGKRVNNGGTLFFPGGYYYFGTTGMRVGGNVRWIGNQWEGTSLNWNAAFTGDPINHAAVALGPDLNGQYGRSGLYTMGSVMEHFALNLPNGVSWGILTLGIGQGSHLTDIQIRNICKGGISITDTFGNSYFKASELFLFGSATSMGASAVGIHSNYGAIVQFDQISIEGSGTGTNGGNFLRGIEIVSGGHMITNYHFENVVTGVDIAGTTPEFNMLVDGMTNTGTIPAGAKGIWIHAGFTGSLQARNLTGGAGTNLIQNDNTGFKAPGPVGVPSYTSAATQTDISIHENVITSGIRSQIAYVSGGTMVPDVALGTTHWITVTSTNPFTIGAPKYSGHAMPSSLQGRRITIVIRNLGAGVMGAIRWDPIYHMSAWTNPANNFFRTIDFEWNGGSWYQVGQTGVDIPN